MTKQEKIEKKKIDNVIKRDRKALRNAKLNVDQLKFDDIEIAFAVCLNACDTMHVCLHNAFTFDDTVSKMIELKYYNNKRSASNRLHRHIHFDTDSRSIARTIALNARISAFKAKIEAQAQAQE
jgi:hypothetical protein